MVNIRVRRVCEARLLAVPERIEFVAAAEGADAAVSLFPKVRLELCDMQCKDEALVIEATVALKVSWVFRDLGSAAALLYILSGLRYAIYTLLAVVSRLSHGWG